MRSSFAYLYLHCGQTLQRTRILMTAMHMQFLMRLVIKCCCSPLEKRREGVKPIWRPLQGNAYLMNNFPKLTYIQSAQCLDWSCAQYHQIITVLAVTSWDACRTLQWICQLSSDAPLTLSNRDVGPGHWGEESCKRQFVSMSQLILVVKFYWLTECRISFIRSRSWFRGAHGLVWLSEGLPGKYGKILLCREWVDTKTKKL